MISPNVRRHVDLRHLGAPVPARRPPRSRRSAPRDGTAWSSTRRRRAAVRGRAARPTTARCRRSRRDPAGARRRARGSPSSRGRAPRDRATSAFSRIATSVSIVAGAVSARCSQPSAPRRFASTCMNPGSRSSTASRRRLVARCGPALAVSASLCSGDMRVHCIAHSDPAPTAGCPSNNIFTWN